MVEGTVLLPGIAPGTGCTAVSAVGECCSACGGVALGPGNAPCGLLPVCGNVLCAAAGATEVISTSAIVNERKEAMVESPLAREPHNIAAGATRPPSGEFPSSL